MQNPNTVVSKIIRFKSATEGNVSELLKGGRQLSIELEGGRHVLLDPSNPRSAGFAQILEGVFKLRIPVYMEIDSKSEAVTLILIPYVARVFEMQQIDSRFMSVEISSSHARHLLAIDNPDFLEMEKLLRVSIRDGIPVTITENDAHEIINVHLYTPEPGEPPLPFFKPKLLPKLKWRLCWLKIIWCWFWPWCRCLSFVKAQQVFDAMNATTCNPLTVPPPCIPFLYPDDGCWGRAHEMCRLMINMGLKPKKVWIQGSLHVSTKNNPNCNVYWGWHVAPTLCVRGPGFFQVRDMVIDPSLFTTPVSKLTWKSIQGDPGATLTDSAASIFYLWGSLTDPNYVQTNQVLATYRLQLQNRSLNVGVPPYANCQ
ncbi:protein-glutamine glutaminase family protein [Flavobacterium sp. H122]|uniref:protein-glutamine glutaminase family protein n=1 Tax=Flavobacterium sp. H122 TaxID=2529860 RepID=UPI0010AAB621|nr:protein-glutamine glutaminase family protein [Flavobacterium sp. H122]